MHRPDHHDRPRREDRFALSDCLDEMRSILFEGSYTSESRIELLLDRIERRQ